MRRLPVHLPRLMCAQHRKVLSQQKHTAPHKFLKTHTKKSNSIHKALNHGSESDIIIKPRLEKNYNVNLILNSVSRSHEDHGGKSKTYMNEAEGRALAPVCCGDVLCGDPSRHQPLPFVFLVFSCWARLTGQGAWIEHEAILSILLFVRIWTRGEGRATPRSPR